MLDWLKKKNDNSYNELLFQVKEVSQKLQQVMEENKKLQIAVEENKALRDDIKRLQDDIKQKECLIEKEKKRYKVYNGMLLSDEQSAVVDLLEYTDNCYFITGKAGTGKSTVLKYFVENTRKKVVALAPTGIAANIIGGRTIHSFFGLGLTIQDVKKESEVNSGINAESKLIEELDAIIIDEASMVRSDVMDMIDHKLQVARKNYSPYGGVQMILFGDLFQLAPVVKGKEIPIIQSRYQTAYFFGAPSAKENFVVCSLTAVFRQSDAAFIKTLNKIRIGAIKQTELDELYMCCGNKRQIKTDMYIVPTNEQVSTINNKQLRLLTTDEYTYRAEIIGDATEDDTPTSEKITLKVGAVVMMLCNDINKNYINGTLAKVVDLTDDTIKVRISGVGIICVERYTWRKYQYVYNEEEDTIKTEQTGSFKQFPIKLAYAITVHKSQGQTFDHATIDFKNVGAFAPGQTYVALSRCRRLEDIQLSVPITEQDIIVNHEAMNYMIHNAIPALEYAKEHLLM